MPKTFHTRLAAFCVGTLSLAPLAHADGKIFDELRFGGVGSIEHNGNHEDGVFIQGIMFFDPWNRESQDGWWRTLTPRVHLGGQITTAGETNQVFAGFSWTADLGQYFFIEGGFGGSLNDGKVDEDGTPGPKLGSHLLFHEYAAVGVNLDKNWRIVGEIDHSSHANLADGPNSGLSRAGVMIGYKF